MRPIARELKFPMFKQIYRTCSDLRGRGPSNMPAKSWWMFELCFARPLLRGSLQSPSRYDSFRQRSLDTQRLQRRDAAAYGPMWRNYADETGLNNRIYPQKAALV